MVAGKAGSGRRGNSKKANARRRRDSSDDDDDDDNDDEEEEEEEGPPLKFVLAGDDTGSGIDYNVLEEESWDKLEEYCKVRYVRCRRRPVQSSPTFFIIRIAES